MLNAEIIVALPVETQGLFEKEKISVCYSGIGKINATQAALEAILKKQVNHIINLGTAGSHKFETHSLIELSGTTQRDMDLTPLGFKLGETPFDAISGLISIDQFYTDLQKGVCGTGDRFETSFDQPDYDLVDMEAYAIAKICKKHNVRFTSIKYITDGSDEHADKDWIKNLPRAAQALHTTYKEILEKFKHLNLY